MDSALTIKQVDRVDGIFVLVELSDGRTIKITLEQILACQYEVVFDPGPELELD